MVKPTSSLALAALGVSTAVLGVAATSCSRLTTVTTTVTTAAATAARPLSCFPTELDCAVLVSYCTAPPAAATSASASSSVRGQPGTPPAETLPYGRDPSEHGGATATAPGQATRLAPVPESWSSALVHPGLGPSSSLAQGPPWQHHTHERANCSSWACINTPTPSAPLYGSSPTAHGGASLTVVSSATGGSVSASSSNAASPPAPSTISAGTPGRITSAGATNDTATAPTGGGVPTAWPEHHAPSSWGTGTGPHVSRHGTESPGGYDFSIPAPPSVSSVPGVSPTARSSSESVDAATGSASTSSDTPASTGTTLLTTRKSAAHGHFSATASVTEPTRASYKPSSSQTSSREAPSYAEPPSYRAHVRPFRR